MSMLLSLLSPSGANARLSILIWHRVLPQQDAVFPGEMHASRFDEALGWVKRTFNVLPLDEAVARLKAGTLPSKALSITFDDGYEDNYSVALPLLQKHNLPATVFVATGFLDGGLMWNDSVIETVRRLPQGTFDTGALGLGSFQLQDATSRREAIEALIKQIKYLDFDTRKKIVADLANKAGVELPNNLMMSSDQVRQLWRASVVIGAHTCLHPILARLPSAAAQTEIVEGRRQLEQIINGPVSVFAYPNGVPNQDYMQEHVQMVREAGFAAAVSTAWGASGAKDDVFQLRRFSPWDTSKLSFLMRMGRNLIAKPETELVPMQGC